MCEQSFSTPMDTGGLFLASEEESVVALDVSATANLVCFRRLERCNRPLKRYGFQKAAT